MEWMILPFRRYADFSGRSRRMEFWMWMVLQFFVYLGFSFVGAVFGMAGAEAMAASAGPMLVLSLLQLGWWLGTLVPHLAVTVRRLHDSNRTGWWVVAPIVPFVLLIASVIGNDLAGLGASGGAIAAVVIVSLLAWLAMSLLLVVLLFLEGTRGMNCFGPDPKQPTPAEIFA